MANEARAIQSWIKDFLNGRSSGPPNPSDVIRFADDYKNLMQEYYEECDNCPNPQEEK